MFTYIFSSSEEATIWRIYSYKNKRQELAYLSSIVRIVLNHFLMEKLRQSNESFRLQFQGIFNLTTVQRWEQPYFVDYKY